MSNEGGAKTSNASLLPRGLIAPLLALLIGIGIGFAINVHFHFHVGLPVAERVHRLLEDAYFIAGIVIAGLAAVGLHQLQLTSEGLKLTQELARKGEAREALKLASEQCNHFAATVVPACDAVVVKINENDGCYSQAIRLPNLFEPSFTVVDNKIQIPGFKLDEAKRQMKELGPDSCMNILEGFAIFFVSRMANDDVGYFETGIAFLQIMQILMPCFHVSRVTRTGSYPSAISLYERWQKRYITEHLIRARNDLDKRITGNMVGRI